MRYIQRTSSLFVSLNACATSRQVTLPSRLLGPKLRLPITMSTAESAKTHLAQQNLSPNDKAILKELEGWLEKAVFGEPPKDQDEKPADDFEVCVDGERPRKWDLLAGMDLTKKVRYDLIIAKMPANI